MKPADIRKESDEQLALTLKDSEKHLFNLRFQSATDRLETPSEIRKARRDIARLTTEQRGRELKIEAALGDAAIEANLALANINETSPGKAFLGRRKARRVVIRLTAIQTQRAELNAKAAAKTAAKGK